MMKTWAITDVGLVRKENQDAYRIARGGDVCVVCDGMGGHKAGEIASKNAVEVFCSKIIASPCLEEKPDRILEFIRYTLVCAASEANSVIFHLSSQYDEYHGMGTTLVAAILFKGWFYAINIGDSRLYIVTRYEAKQVTKDHSFVQYLIDNGKLTPDEAKYYPRKNVITRAVGVGEKLDVDFFSAPLEPWESGYLLLCSDGLSNYADNKILVDILYGSMSRSRSSPEIDLSKKADMLIAYANAKGGADNITAVLAKF